MTKTWHIITLFLLIFSLSCSDDACGDVLCFTPPSPFEFELLDKVTGENLFTNGTFNPNDIKVINRADQRAVEFAFISENDYNIILVHTIGWQTETVNYSFQVGSETLFDLFVAAERMDSDCCAHTEYHEIRIENTEFQRDASTGIYKIWVE